MRTLAICGLVCLAVSSNAKGPDDFAVRIAASNDRLHRIEAGDESRRRDELARWSIGGDHQTLLHLAYTSNAAGGVIDRSTEFSELETRTLHVLEVCFATKNQATWSAAARCAASFEDCFDGKLAWSPVECDGPGTGLKLGLRALLAKEVAGHQDWALLLLDEDDPLVAANISRALGSVRPLEVSRRYRQWLFLADQRWRSVALSRLSGLESPENVDVFRRYLEDSSPEIRAVGMHNIERMEVGREDLCDALCRLFPSANSEFKASFLQLSAWITQLNLLALAEKLRTSPDVEVRASALMYLAAKNKPLTLPEVEWALANAHGEPLLMAVGAAGGHPSLFDQMYRRLDDPDDDVSAAAWKSACEEALTPSLPRLVNRYLADKVEDSRPKFSAVDLSQVLARLAPETDVLVRLLARDSRAGARSLAVMAATRLAAMPRLAEILDGAAKDKCEIVRQELAHSLGGLPMRIAMPWLKRLIHDPQESVWTEALATIANHGGPSEFAYLKSLVRGSNRVLSAAVAAKLEEKASEPASNFLRS